LKNAPTAKQSLFSLEVDLKWLFN